MNTDTGLQDITLAQAMPLHLQWLQQKKLSDETCRGYRIDMNQFLGWMSRESNAPIFVDQITNKDVEGFLSYLAIEKKSSASTLNRKANALSSFFTFMKKKHVISENPLEEYERMKIVRKERVFLDRSEIEAIIDAISHPVAHYFVIMMAFTGIRINECINLTLQDVDLEEGMVYIINGKGGKDRNVPMNVELMRHMKDYLDNERPQTKSHFFFALKKTGTISMQYINRILKDACIKAKIQKHVSSHILRHSFASYLVKEDVNVVVIQKLLGHANIKTTSIYLHAKQEDLRDAVNQIEYQKGEKKNERMCI